MAIHGLGLWSRADFQGAFFGARPRDAKLSGYLRDFGTPLWTHACWTYRYVSAPVPKLLLICDPEYLKIENIMRIRAATIVKLLQIPNKCIELFKNTTNVSCKHGSRACDAIVYGSLIQSLQIAKLDLAVAANVISTTVVGIAEKLSNLVVHVYYDNKGFGFSHNNCFTTDIKKEVDAIMTSIEDPLLESHIRHMAIQRAKLNLGN